MLPPERGKVMYALNLTPHPFNGSVIAGKWRITTCKVRSSDWKDKEVSCYRADNFSAIIELLSRIAKEKVPVKVELVGLYYYELYFDLEDGKDDLPFDLSVFLYCLF